MSPAALRQNVLKFAACGSLLAALWFFTVPDTPVLPLCGFHWLTGRPCPFCGLTRAMFALAKGQWAGALNFNVLSPLGFAMLFSLLWRGPVRDRLWTGGLGAFAVYGMARVFFPGT
jgi:hypothetical protein